MAASVPKVDMVIVAPCPLGLDIDNGWLDRIWVVDRVFNDKTRLYLNFAPHHCSRLPLLTQRSEGVFEAQLHPSLPLHKAFVARIVEQAQAVYVHTVHGAKYVLDWLASGKVMVDIHGVVPEEEYMLGRSEQAAEYEPVEEAVLRSAKCCVLVSNAMREHYLKKYPGTSQKFVVLPIVQAAEPITPNAAASRADLPAHVIYSGGVQAWQNIDAMLQFCARASPFAQFSFLSKDWPLIQAAGRRHGAPKGTRYALASKRQLKAEYQGADFGLVLRDAHIVNRVSCPTKLFDYLCHGVVPIVRSPLLGDFDEYGYSYVTETEFGEGFFPDFVTRRWMIDNNHEVLRKFVASFQRGMIETRLAALEYGEGSRQEATYIPHIPAMTRPVTPDINLEIPGQTGEVDLLAMAMLAKEVPPHGTIVETGSLYGRSSYVWAKNCDSTVRVFCIDPWEREHWIIEIVEKPQDVSKPFSFDAFAHYTRNCRNIITIRGKSPDVVNGAWTGPIDIYFDDSDHCNPGLSRNYEFWIPFVKPGGIVAGDDYGEHAPDVMRFAENLAMQWNQPLRRARYLWWLVKPAT